MRKFPKIKYPNDPETDGLKDGEVVVLEKLDGANFRFGWRDGELKIGTRNVEYDDPWDENRPHAFEHAVEYIESKIYGSMLGTSNVVFFGEAMHLHSLNYEDINWEQPHKGSPHVPLDSDQPNVVLFDVYDEARDRWLHWDDVVGWAETLDIAYTPVIERGDPDDLAFEIPEESTFGGPPEGIVARRVDGSVRAKKVTEDFKEQNAVTFNDSSKAQSESAEFVAAFVTDQRIEKMAHKLIDRGEYDSLQMQMMEDLPREVLKDVGEEVFWSELLSSGGFEAEWDDDFKDEVRSKASKKCARVLKTMVQEF